jgi:hypothetical protein
MGSIDVELVPLSSTQLGSRGRLTITRRDLLVFGLGVGSTLLAILSGWLVALLFRKRKPEVENNETEKDKE